MTPMPLELTKEEKQIVLTAAEVAEKSAAPHAAEVDSEARFPKEAMQALGASGLLGLTVPRDLGGMGSGPRVFTAVVEKLAERCASTAMCYTMHISAVASFVVSKTLADRAQLLGEIAAGRHLTTLAYSERESRSVFWAPMSKLTGGPAAYETSANKSWVTSAREANSYVSSAQMPGAASPQQSVIYFVDAKAPGVKVTGKFDGLGLRGNDSVPVAFENVRIEASSFLCPPGEGLSMMLQVSLPWFALGTSAVATGIGLACIGETAKHLGSAEQQHAGAKLRDIPVVRARLGRMSMLCEQARALLSFAAMKVESPAEDTPLYVLRARLAAVESAVAVSDLGMKACGGAAFSKHLAIERCFRDARAGWVMAPTADHLEDFLGRALSGLPLL